MTAELERAVRRYKQWFGSYKKSGELKKIQVWLVVNKGRIEFTTQTDSYKVKRVRRNPRVVCLIGSKEGPTISGTAEIVTDQGCCLARVPRQLEDSPANDSFPRMRN